MVTRLWSFAAYVHAVTQSADIVTVLFDIPALAPITVILYVPGTDTVNDLELVILQ